MNSTRPEGEGCPFCGHADGPDRAGVPGTIFVCPQCAQRRVIPFTLGGLEVHAVLRTGGMGTIYLAWDPPLHRWVAVKAIREDLAHRPEFREAFRREARIAATLSHPNVIRIYAFGEEGGIPFLVMEHVTAETLADRIDRDGPLPYALWLRLARELTGALQMMAQRGVFHCDIKPGNILLEPSGAIRLTDFGLAMASVDDAPTDSSGEIWGTPYYLAPERALGAPTSERSEIYSLGATLYHAAAGRPPVDGPTVDDLLASLRSGEHRVALPPTVSTRLPPRAGELILAMLAADPPRRPPTFSAALALLDELPRAWNAHTRPNRTLIIIIIMVVLLQPVVIWLAVQRARERVAPATGESQELLPSPEAAPTQAPAPESSQAAAQPPADSSPVVPPEPAPSAETLPPQATAWEQARQLLAAGKLAEAVPLLDPLVAGDPPAPEALPYRHLAQLWGALARLAAGEKEPAEVALKSLVDEGAKTDPSAGVTPESAAAAAAAAIGLGAAAPEAIAAKAPPHHAAALGSLIQALRETGGEPNRVLAHLQTFGGELREAGSPWWQPALQALADSLAASTELFAKALAAAAEREQAGDLAGGAEGLRTAAASISAVPWRQRLSIEATRFDEKRAAAARQQEGERKRQEVERWKAERAQVQELDETIAPLIAQLEFGQAAQQVESLLERVQTESIAEPLRSQLAYLEAAEKVIRSMVIAAARHLGFHAVLRTRNGQSISGLVQQISRREISLQTGPSGSTVLRWNDVALASVLEIALQGFLLDEQQEEVTPTEHRDRYAALGQLARSWRATSVAEHAAHRLQFWAPRSLPRPIEGEGSSAGQPPSSP